MGSAGRRPLSWMVAAALCLLTGCAQTIILEDGRPVAYIQGDAIDIYLKTYKGGIFSAKELNHSVPTKAGGAAVAQGAGALGTAVAVGATSIIK